MGVALLPHRPPQEVVTTVMPGLITDLPWVKKLRIHADAASAESQARYFTFETEVLQTAFDVIRAYYSLWFLDENIRINRQTLDLLAELEEIARAQNSAAKVTLQDVYRAQIEQDQLTTEIENLEDSRGPLIAQLKGALGLSRDQADPPQPTRFESTPLDLNADALLDTALTRNLALLQIKLLPKARQSLEIARAGYLSGHIDFFNLLDAERTLLNFQLLEVEARTRREIVLADLSLSIAGIAPEGAPWLPPTTSTSAPSSNQSTQH